MKRELVYLLSRDKGVYWRERGRWYFPDRVHFRGAKKGFARVQVFKEEEKCGFLSGRMLSECKIDLDECGKELFGISHWWNLLEIGGNEVLVNFTLDGLDVYIDGEVISDWGDLEGDVYLDLIQMSSKDIYLGGYYFESIGGGKEVGRAELLDTMGWSADAEVCRVEEGWYMCNPYKGKGLYCGCYVGDRYYGMDMYETVELWKFVQKRHKVEVCK